MPNDTNTLNGALQELGETMADNLVAKGVSASASDGLTTLAGKILDIQTGGSCYHIEFGEASYTAFGGSATLEIYLQENYAPKSGATVTVTGSDGSAYNGITNTNGLASITVSVSSETTFTCTYSNVSDTCTVIIPVYLFYDDCSSSSRLSEYGSSVALTSSRASTLTYVSSENAYYFNRSSSGDSFTGFQIPITTYDNIKITLKAKLSATSAYCQFGVYIKQSSNVFEFLRIRGDKVLDGFKNNTNSSLGSNSNVASFNTAYYYLEISYTGTSRAIKVYDANRDLVKEWNLSSVQTYTSPVFYIAHNNNSTGAYIKEIKVEAL